jgi:acyl-CoA synthetase (AMP-forming)/AMP-acid ligase II
MVSSAPAPLAPPGFAAGLRRWAGAPALVTPDGVLSYDDLADRVRDVADRLGPQRRLVLLEAAHTVEAVVGYLAALTAGCPVLLTAGASAAGLTAAYDPDVVLLGDDGWDVRERRTGTAHELHEDLALLLSTSGSTGSPKLVRLSRDNLTANAAAIAAYLDLRPSDVGVTTLPMGYCYGLSVLNSHLHTGAAVLLTDLSVADPCFWELFRQHGVSSLAGVPHTFDLLDRSGFAERDLPSLRRVTQAGGRLAPERVAGWAALGQRRGWDFYVMYGQTEATARMAYLPPDLAREHPGAIGRPVPGGQFALEALDGDEAGDGVGELVYSGPNVMLGYATSPQDLALGRTVDRLRTGDLARRNAAGLYEIVGRRSRIAKVFGLRIDLSRVEEQVAARGTSICCAVRDDALVVAARCPASAAREVARSVAAAAGLPLRAVRLVAVEELPRLANGKPDLRAVAELAGPAPVATSAPAVVDADGLCALFAEVLDRPVRPQDTFVGLGGDSLSYVETSLRLEQLLGTLPADWHVTPLRDLAPAARRRRPGRALETGVLLRGLAILLIVGSHTDLWVLVGGAHVLLGIAGFNVARFSLSGADGISPARRVLRSTGRIVVPAVAWIAGAAALSEDYTLTNVLLLNGIVGPREWGPTWHYWFLEVLVHLLLVTAALLALPGVRRAERRWPWGFALVLLAAGVASRFSPGWLPTGPDRIHTAHVVFWLFALGWAAARADSVPRRLLLTVVLLATVPGFFDDGRREAIVVAGLLTLLWVRTVRVPAAGATAASALAAASLHIYVTHWSIYPHLEPWSPLAATVASVALGLAYFEVCRRVGPVLGRAGRTSAPDPDIPLPRPEPARVGAGSRPSGQP